MKVCPNCGSQYVKCPECNEVSKHGEKSHCPNESCKVVNAPLDCYRCGLTVSNDLKGVLTLDMELLPYRQEGES